jgi:NAD(P)-dependent dehydrogenase (short-subunit alcohol dehydrogenase family)
VLERAPGLIRSAAKRVRLRGSASSGGEDASRLDGKVAVVCGGTGEVGEGIVAGLLIAGAKVAVPSRSGERLAELADRLEASGAPTERFVPLVGDLTEMPDGAHEVAEELCRLTGRPDIVVVALGGWIQTDALADLEIDTWDAVIDGALRAHQLAAAAFVPLMRGRPGAMYVQINGAAARYPVPGAGAVSVAAAGELMQAQVMAAEEAGHGIQVESLILGPVKTRSRDDAAPWMLSARDIGDLIALRAARRSQVAEALLSAVAEAGGQITQARLGAPVARREADDDLVDDDRPAPPRQIHPDALAPGGPATVLELLTAADLRPARAAAAGAVRGARGASLGWVLWGLQTASLSKQVRRGDPPPSHE